MNAVLPEWHLQRVKVVKDIPLGITAWATPYMMWVDRDRRCWLPAHGQVEYRSSATDRMSITHDDRGWHVVISFDETYRPEDEPPFPEKESVEWIPVVTLSTAEDWIKYEAGSTR